VASFLRFFFSALVSPAVGVELLPPPARPPAAAPPGTSICPTKAPMSDSYLKQRNNGIVE